MNHTFMSIFYCTYCRHKYEIKKSHKIYIYIAKPASLSTIYTHVRLIIPLLPLTLSYACALVVVSSSSPSQKLLSLCLVPRAAAGQTCSHCQARTPRETLSHSRTEPPLDTAELPTTTPVSERVCGGLTVETKILFFFFFFFC